MSLTELCTNIWNKVTGTATAVDEMKSSLDAAIDKFGNKDASEELEQLRADKAELEKRPTQESFDAEKTRADKAEQDLEAEKQAHKATKDGEPERINSAISAELAKLGHAPVDTSLSKPETTPEEKKSSELTGLAKTRAAFAKQIGK